MEGSPYSTLKASWSSVSAKALNVSSRQILANYLDVTQDFVSEKKKILRDYRGLAELVGLTNNEIKRIQETGNRTIKILESWETRPAATLDKLISFLEDMGRHDVIEAIMPLLKKNVESYTVQAPVQVPEVTSADVRLSCKSSAVTCDDVINKTSTVYDAFLSYADEDTEIAQEFANFLQSAPIGLKLCISNRDLLAGCRTLDAEIELIKNRCRHMLILLTPNFIKSNALDFQLSFASSIEIEHRQRILLPVVLAPCEIPTIVKNVTEIDFTKPHIGKWNVNKLIISLLHEDKVDSYLNFIKQDSIINPNMIHNSASSEAVNSVPFIPYEESTNGSLCTAIDSHTCNTIVPSDAIDNENKDLDNVKDGSIVLSQMNESRQSSAESSSSILGQFLSRLKKKGMISSSSTTSLSSSTSGSTSGQSSSIM